MENNTRKGSTWRKWDLHIHSPASIVQNYGGNTTEAWEKFMVAIENLPTAVKVIGINDYYFIDGYERIMHERIKNNRLQNIEKIFPILEFRLDTFGSATETKFSKINFHILFNLDESKIKEEIKKVKEEFISRIPLTKLDKHKTTPLSKENLSKLGGNLKDGFENLIPSTQFVFDLLKTETWAEKTFTFLGYIEWNNLDKGEQLKNFKDDVYQHANAFLTASELDCIEKKKEIIEKFGKLQLLHSQDIHDFNKFQNYKCYTWIKADPTFEGLQQILIEPEERIYIGETPTQLHNKKENATYIIDKLLITTNENKNEWFDNVNEISFNSGLVAIIGNKGSGKSALTDIISICGNSLNAKYSFLTKDKFLSPALINVNRKYKASLRFNDNYQSEFIALNEIVSDPTKTEKIVYLSQSFVSDLCDSLDNTKLQNEINRVIFSHIPEQQRYNFNNYDRLIDYLSRTSNNIIENEQRELNRINKLIVELEQKLKPNYKTKLQNQKNELERQRMELEKQKPQEVKPIENEKNNQILEEFRRLNDIFRLQVDDKTNAQDKLNKATIQQKEIELIISEIHAKQQEFKQLIDKINNNQFLKEKSINGNDFIILKINDTKIFEIQNQIKNDLNLFNIEKEKTDTEWQNTKILIHKLNEQLTHEHKQYKDYQILITEWNAKYKNLQTQIDDLHWEIDKIEHQYIHQLRELEDTRKQISTKVVEAYITKSKNLSQLHTSTEELAKRRLEHFKIKNSDLIKFKTDIYFNDNFNSLFFNYIARNRVGSFYGVAEGENLLNDIKSELNINDLSSIAEFPDKILSKLKVNHTTNNENLIENQLRNGVNITDLYNFLFGFSYLDTKIRIKYEEKNINELSPGQKGILLLIFYLIIDNDKRPLIIDQPEENLDNETIFNVLVPIIKEVKKQRQLIIVTHNPNVAIVCDAEQIINTEMDKIRNLITYTCGSIENVRLRTFSLDILEGTEPAFNNRKTKYGA